MIADNLSINLLLRVLLEELSRIIVLEEEETARRTLLAIVAEPTPFWDIASRWVQAAHVERSITAVAHQ